MQAIIILEIHKYPNIVEHIIQNYSKHCIFTGDIPLAKLLPVKCSVCLHLSSLPEFEYPSTIECLTIVVDTSSPFQNGWESYQTILALCPRLKDIIICTPSVEERMIDLQKALHEVSQENRDIWEERISYLKSRGVNVASFKGEFFYSKCKELCKQNKWGFEFRRSH